MAVANFRFRVLLIDGQVAEIAADVVRSTNMGVRFEDSDGLVLSVPAELLLLVERLDRAHRPFPVSDRDLVALYEKARRPAAAPTSPFQLVAVKPEAS